MLALIASVGQVVVPVAVQQTIDHGLNGPGGPDVGYAVRMGLAAAAAIVVAGWASYLMTARLFTAAERGLATLRVKAFRHVHDLPLLTQNTERRGALVSRVTSDVDQVSQFLVFGGLLFVVSVGQVLVATVVMLFYSWQLALVVWVCFAAAASSRCATSSASCPRPTASCAQTGRRDAVGDLGAGGRRRGRALLRRRGPHPGADRHTRSTSTRPRAPAPRASLRSRSRWVASRPAWPTPASIVVGRLAGLRRRHHRRRGAGVRVPGHAVRRPGPDGHPDPHRRPERHRQLAPGDRHPRHPGRPGRPGPGRRQTLPRGPVDVCFDDVDVRLPRRPAGAARHPTST